MLRFYFGDKLNLLIVYVTNACNLACEHCFYAGELNNGVPRMTLEEFERLAASLHGRVRKIALTGGEPFTRSDLDEVITAFHAHGVKEFEINTNGTHTGRILATLEKVKQRFGRAVTLHVSVSLDGLPETHNFIRKSKTNFDEAVRTALAVKAAGFDVYFTTIVSKTNCHELEEMCAYVDRLGIFHNLEVVRGVSQSALPGHLANDFDPKERQVLLDPESCGEVRRILFRIHRDRLRRPSATTWLGAALTLTNLEYKLESIEHFRRLVRCGAGSRMGVVYTGGEVALCEMMKTVGNIKESGYDFSAVWKNAAAKKQREWVPSCHCSHGCFVNYDVHPRFYRSVLRNMVRLQFGEAGAEEEAAPVRVIQ
jgi:MoaA/NifB/PqqE/SkfB family radical SAM enzyme